MYNPTIGRWLTEDPSGTNGGMDLYAYCDNDPINATDPTGLAGESAAAARGRVVGAAIEREMLLKNPGPRNTNQADVQRTVNGAFQDGKADLQIDDVMSEIGPASRTGTSAKLAQIESIEQDLRGNVYLYDQTGTVPGVGDKIPWAKLSPAQTKQLAAEIAGMGNPTNASVMSRAQAIAGPENCGVTEIAEADISQAGRYFNGMKVGGLLCIDVLGIISMVRSGLYFKDHGVEINTFSNEQTNAAMAKLAQDDQVIQPTTITQYNELTFQDTLGIYAVRKESPGLISGFFGAQTRWYKVYKSGDLVDMARHDLTGATSTTREVWGTELEDLKREIDSEMKRREDLLESLQRKYPGMPVSLDMLRGQA